MLGTYTTHPRVVILARFFLNRFPRFSKIIGSILWRFTPKSIASLKHSLIIHDFIIPITSKLHLVEKTDELDLGIWYSENFRELGTADLAIIGIFLPSESSIAKYNQGVFLSKDEGQIVIPTNLDFKDSITLNSADSPRVIPYQMYEKLPKDILRLFSLGNSPDHINTLKMLVNSSTSTDYFRWSLQLHDVSLLWLIELTFGYSYLKSRVNEIYYDKYGEIENPYKLKKSEKDNRGIFGISILCSILGPPDKIIVHNSRAAVLVAKDLKNLGIESFIEVLQLPELESSGKYRHTRNKKSVTSEKLRIGTFGAADKHKNLEETYSLLTELRRKGCDFIWVVAGRNARNYLTSIGINESWIEFYDDPNEFEFMKLMSELDFMLLLRLNSNGESSGVAIQAQYLQIPLICSSSILEGKDSKFHLEVDSVEDLEMMASKVKEFIESESFPNLPTFSPPSANSVLKRILEIL